MTEKSENVKPMADYKMVKLSDRTHKKLCEVGKFQESFDDVIYRVLIENEQLKKKKG